MRVYISGPMRGKPRLNFDIFHAAARTLRAEGYEVLDPAEEDEKLGFDPDEPEANEMLGGIEGALERDLCAITNGIDAIATLPGYENSLGSKAEIALAEALNLHVAPVESFFTRGTKVDYGIGKSFGYIEEKYAGEVRVTNEKTGGQKGQKLARFDLIPWDCLWQVAEHYGKGAEKYEARNWERGYEWTLSIGALGRHLAQFVQGEDVDQETGSSHLAAIVFHAFALMRFSETHPELDDRAPVGKTNGEAVLTFPVDEGLHWKDTPSMGLMQTIGPTDSERDRRDADRCTCLRGDPDPFVFGTRPEDLPEIFVSKSKVCAETARTLSLLPDNNHSCALMNCPGWRNAYK